MPRSTSTTVLTNSDTSGTDQLLLAKKGTSVATTRTKPKAGDSFTLTAPEGHGTGTGTVPAGTKVSIELVHTKPVPGVGGNEGVLFSWVPEDSVNPRSTHLPLEDFQRLFKKAGK